MAHELEQLAADVSRVQAENPATPGVGGGDGLFSEIAFQRASTGETPQTNGRAIPTPADFTVEDLLTPAQPPAFPLRQQPNTEIPVSGTSPLTQPTTQTPTVEDIIAAQGDQQAPTVEDMIKVVPPDRPPVNFLNVSPSNPQEQSRVERLNRRIAASYSELLTRDTEGFDDLSRSQQTDLLNNARSQVGLTGVLDIGGKQTLGEFVSEDLLAEGGISRRLPFIGVIPVMQYLYRVGTAAERIKAGTATLEHWETLADFQDDMVEQKRGKTIPAAAASIFSESLPFLIEFLASSGLISIVKGGVRQLTKKGAETLAKKSLAEILLVGARASITIAGESVIRLPVFAHRVAADAIRRQVPTFVLQPGDENDIAMIVDSPGDDLFEALKNATLDVYIEVASESSGQLFGVIGLAGAKIPVVKMAFKKFQEVKASLMGAFMRKTGMNLKRSAEFLAQAGYHGVIAEMGEEEVGKIMRAASGLEPYVFTTAEEAAAQALAFGALGVGGTALTALSSRTFTDIGDRDAFEKGTIPPDDQPRQPEGPEGIQAPQAGGTGQGGQVEAAAPPPQEVTGDRFVLQKKGDRFRVYDTKTQKVVERYGEALTNTLGKTIIDELNEIEQPGSVPPPLPTPPDPDEGLNEITPSISSELFEIKSNSDLVRQALIRRGFTASKGAKYEYFTHPSGQWRYRLQARNIRKEIKSPRISGWKLVPEGIRPITVKDFADRIRARITEIQQPRIDQATPKQRPPDDQEREVRELGIQIAGLEASLRTGKNLFGEPLGDAGRKQINDLLQAHQTRLTSITAPVAAPKVVETTKVTPQALKAPEKAPVKVDLENNINDSHRGELFGEIIARDPADGKPVGVIGYSYLSNKNQVFVNDLKVGPKRQGIATQMFLKLFEEYPDEAIAFGSTTPDGTAFLESMKKRGLIPDRVSLFGDQPTKPTIPAESRITAPDQSAEEASKNLIKSLTDELVSMREDLVKALNDKLVAKTRNTRVKADRAVKGFKKSIKELEKRLNDADVLAASAGQQSKPAWEMTKKEFSESDIVRFHGTPDGDFTVFSAATKGKRSKHAPDDVGFHFTTNRETAGSYSLEYLVESAELAEKVLGHKPEAFDVPPFPKTFEVVLEMENPLRLGSPKEINKKTIEKAKEAGHDGIIADAGDGTEYVVFYPEQILTHREIVKQARRTGETIPPQVLAEYPELLTKKERRALKAKSFGEVLHPDDARERYKETDLEFVVNEILDLGHTIYADGTMIFYHSTTKEAAEKIRKEGKLRRPADAPDTFGVHFSTSEEVTEEFGDGTLVRFRAKIEDIQLQDTFPSGRMDFMIETKRGTYTPVEILEIIPSLRGKFLKPKPDPLEQLQEGEQPSQQEPEVKVAAADTQKAAKIRADADKMDKAIDAKMNPAIATQNPTRRRAGIAAGMRAEGERLITLQAQMRGIADALEAGTLPIELATVNSRAFLESLNVTSDKAPLAWITQSELDEIHKKSATGRGIRSNKVIDGRTLIGTMRGDVSEREGFGFGVFVTTTKQTQALQAVLKNLDENNKLDNSMRNLKSELTEGHRFIKALDFTSFSRDSGRVALDKQFVTMKTQVKAIAVKPVGIRTDEQKALEEAERQLITLNVPGFFPTPEAVIDNMLDKAEIEKGHKVLEPSAGKGDIADKLRDIVGLANLDLAEISMTLRDFLAKKGYNDVEQDFLEDIEGLDIYDRIVMNPPFEKGQDIDHVERAFQLLKPGGRLVSIMSEGTFFNQAKKQTDFRAFLEAHDAEIEKLPEGSFKGAFKGTGVAARIVTIVKESQEDVERIDKEIDQEATKLAERKQAREAIAAIGPPTEGKDQSLERMDAEITRREESIEKLADEGKRVSDQLQKPSSERESFANIPTSRVSAKRQGDRGWKLFWIGTRNEVFPGQLFRTAPAARKAFEERKKEDQQTAPAVELNLQQQRNEAEKNIHALQQTAPTSRAGEKKRAEGMDRLRAEIKSLQEQIDAPTTPITTTPPLTPRSPNFVLTFDTKKLKKTLADDQDRLQVNLEFVNEPGGTIAEIDLRHQRITDLRDEINLIEDELARRDDRSMIQQIAEKGVDDAKTPEAQPPTEAEAEAASQTKDDVIQIKQTIGATDTPDSGVADGPTNSDGLSDADRANLVAQESAPLTKGFGVNFDTLLNKKAINEKEAQHALNLINGMKAGRLNYKIPPPAKGRSNFGHPYNGRELPKWTKLRSRLEAVLQDKMIEIPIPGVPDAMFYATPETEKAVRALAVKAAAIKTLKTKPGSTFTTFTGAKPSRPLGRPHDGKLTQRIATLELAVARNPSRYGLTHVLVTPTHIVATNGKVLWTLEGDFTDILEGKLARLYPFDKKGTLKKPLELVNFKEDDEGTPEIGPGGQGVYGKNRVGFPPWLDQMRSHENPYTIDVEKTYDAVRKARALTNIVAKDEAIAVVVVLNPRPPDPNISHIAGRQVSRNVPFDPTARTLGFVTYVPAVGQAEINVQEGAVVLGSVSPELLMDALKMHWKNGNENVLFSYPSPEKALLLTGTNSATMVMPLDSKGAIERTERKLGDPGLYAEDVTRTLDRFETDWTVFGAVANGLRTAFRHKETGEIWHLQKNNAQFDLEVIDDKYLKGEDDKRHADIAIEAGFVNADGAQLIWIPFNETIHEIVLRNPIEAAMIESGLKNTGFDTENVSHRVALAEAVDAWDAWQGLIDMQTKGASVSPTKGNAIAAEKDKAINRLAGLIRENPFIREMKLQTPLPEFADDHNKIIAAGKQLRYALAQREINKLDPDGKIVDPDISSHPIQEFTPEELKWMRNNPDKPTFGMGAMFDLPDTRGWTARIYDHISRRMHNPPAGTIRERLFNYIGRGIFGYQWGLTRGQFVMLERIKGEKNWGDAIASTIKGEVRTAIAERISVREDARGPISFVRADVIKKKWHRELEDAMRGDRPFSDLSKRHHEIRALYANPTRYVTDTILANPWMWPSLQAFGLKNIEQVIAIKAMGPGEYLRRLYQAKPGDLFYQRTPAVREVNLSPRIRAGGYLPKRGDEDFYFVWNNTGKEVEYLGFIEEADAEKEMLRIIDLKIGELGTSVFDRVKVLDPFSVDELEGKGLIDPIRDIEILMTRTIIESLENLQTLKTFAYLNDTVGMESGQEIEGYIDLPNHPALGPLAGRAVPEPVWHALNQYETVRSGMLYQVWHTYNFAFKKTKVLWSLPTWMRNLRSVVVFQFLDNMNPISDAKWIKMAIREFIDHGPNWEILVRRNEINRGWTGAELKDFEQLVTSNISSWPTSANEWIDNHPKLLATIKKYGLKAKRVEEMMSNLYEMPDQVVKLASYLKKTQKTGMSQDEAIASLWMYHNYDRAGKFAVRLRRSPIGPLFIMFDEQMLKIYMRAFRDKPARLLALATAPAIITLATRMLMGVSDEEMEILDQDVRRQGAWVNKYMQPIIPIRDDTGAIQFIDLRYEFPMVDLFKLETGAGGVALPYILTQPWISLLKETGFNEIQYTGQAIWFESDSFGVKVAKWGKHAILTAAPIPSFVAKRGGGSIDRLINAALGNGREAVQRVLLREVFGIRVQDPWIRREDAFKLCKQALGDDSADHFITLLGLFDEIYGEEFDRRIRVSSVARALRRDRKRELRLSIERGAN